jgi:hypothetical protein
MAAAISGRHKRSGNEIFHFYSAFLTQIDIFLFREKFSVDGYTHRFTRTFDGNFIHLRAQILEDKPFNALLFLLLEKVADEERFIKCVFFCNVLSDRQLNNPITDLYHAASLVRLSELKAAFLPTAHVAIQALNSEHHIRLMELLNPRYNSKEIVSLLEGLRKKWEALDRASKTIAQPVLDLRTKV